MTLPHIRDVMIVAKAKAAKMAPVQTVLIPFSSKVLGRKGLAKPYIVLDIKHAIKSRNIGQSIFIPPSFSFNYIYYLFFKNYIKSYEIRKFQ